MHLKVITEKQRLKERAKIVRDLKESQKTEYIFNDEYLYEVGRGHDFAFGFFTTYVTKSGIWATEYGNYWAIGANKYELVDGEWIELEEPEETVVDLSSVDFTFPVVKSTHSRLLSDELISVTPLNGPKRSYNRWWEKFFK